MASCTVYQPFQKRRRPQSASLPGAVRQPGAGWVPAGCWPNCSEFIDWSQARCRPADQGQGSQHLGGDSTAVRSRMGALPASPLSPLMLALPPPPKFSCCPPSAHRPRIHPRLGRPRPAPQPPNRSQTQAAAAMTVAQPPAEGTYQPRSILVTGGAGEEGRRRARPIQLGSLAPCSQPRPAPSAASQASSPAGW